MEKYAERILALITEQRDLTLDEIVSALHKRRIPGNRSALSRFLLARPMVTETPRQRTGHLSRLHMRSEGS